MKLASAFLVSVACLALAPAGRAQMPEPGFSLDRFDPATMGSDWFSQDSLDLRGNGRFSLGVLADYARKPLVIYDTAGNEVTAPIENQLTLHLGGAVNLLGRFRLGFSLPLVVINEGRSGSLAGRFYEVDEGFAVGDLRLAGDVRLFGEYGDFVTAALGLAVHLPTGKREAFTSDGKPRIVPRLLLAGDAALFTWAFSASYDGRIQQDDFGDQPFGSELQFGAAAGLKLADGAVVLGPEIFGSTVVSDEGAFEERTTPVEILFGAHFKIARSVLLAIGGGPGINRSLGSPEYRLTALLGFFSPYQPPPPPDRDGDGIPDPQDACPTERGIPTDDPRTHGCPDSDGDGIVDSRDACPNDPGPPSSDSSKNGCPDSDGDGIVDPQDACPQEPGLAHEDPAKNGCPDTDGDGIFDKEDACPTVPGVPSPDPAKNGCPSDRDGDGIVDADDACPDEFGDADPDPTKNGCPKVKVEEKEIKILERIEFDTAKATIRPESEPVLNAVLRVLSENLDILKVRVEGHTDSRGGDRYNLRLSQSRAESVVNWLVERGVARERLEPVGLGERQPIDSNDTPDGRQTNRRVQFIILERAAPSP